MENWGCITFERTVLLTDDSHDNSDVVYRRLRTVCHEVCHSWFGNLVTMEWWEDIWLNEGFARYIEHVVLSKLRPYYNVWKLYIAQVYYQGLAADKDLDTTHPV